MEYGNDTLRTYGLRLGFSQRKIKIAHDFIYQTSCLYLSLVTP